MKTYLEMCTEAVERRMPIIDSCFQAMKCMACGFAADESDFTATDIVGKRLCPKCNSSECYVQAEDDVERDRRG
jgi:Zn finger protein HypA/HybF involved in hydrogenase expression